MKTGMTGDRVEAISGVFSQTLLKVQVSPKAELLATFSISEQGTLYLNPTVEGQARGIAFAEYPLLAVSKVYLKNCGIKLPKKAGNYLFRTKDFLDLVVIVGVNGEFYVPEGAPVALRATR